MISLSLGSLRDRRSKPKRRTNDFIRTGQAFIYEKCMAPPACVESFHRADSLDAARCCLEGQHFRAVRLRDRLDGSLLYESCKSRLFRGSAQPSERRTNDREKPDSLRASTPKPQDWKRGYGALIAGK
jgi:hypothetical protein